MIKMPSKVYVVAAKKTKDTKIALIVHKTRSKKAALKYAEKLSTSKRYAQISVGWMWLGTWQDTKPPQVRRSPKRR